MSAPGADASAAAAPEGAPAPGKKKKLGKKERQRLKAIADGTYVAPVLPQKQPPKAKQARQPYNGGMAPSLLTKYIKEAWTTTALLETCEQYQDRMNKIHASASWNCLGRLATAAADARWFDRDRRALEALARKTTEMVLASVDVRSEPAEDASANAVMGARELANVVHGLAKCGAAHASDEPGETFFDDPDGDDGKDVSKKNTFDDSTRGNTDDGKNTTDSHDPLQTLVAALAAALTARARECNAQEAANAAWAFRKLGREGDPLLYAALAFVARREAEKDAMNPQELTNAAWAFSGVLAAETETYEQTVTNDVAFAEDVARTVDALASSAAKRLCDFDARGVCVLTCALAKAKRAVSRFTHGMPRNDGIGCDGVGGSALSALANETKSRVARVAEEKNGFFKEPNASSDPATFYFSARDVAASSWAFASLDFFDESLFATLASASVALCARGAFDARALANVAWAHAKANVGGDEAGRRKLFQSVAGALTDACAAEPFFKGSANTDKEMSSRDIANSAWAFAKACFPDDALFDALRLCAVRRDPGLEKFNNQDLVNAAWAYAKLAARGAGALFRAARATVAARADADAFTAANITTLVWAMHSAPGLEGVETTERTKGKENETEIPFSAVSEALARAAARACVSSEPAELAATAWTFADAIFRDASDASRAVPSKAHKDLFRTLGSRVCAILESNATGGFKEQASSFGDEELDNLEWAFSKAGDPGSVLRRVKAARRDMAGDTIASLNGGSRLSKEHFFDPSFDPSTAIKSDVGSREETRRGAKKDENENASTCGLIVVAGGGIGGAAVALALQRSNFEVVVLESDAGFDARKQGYGLTVQGTDLRDGLGIDLTADDAPSTSHYTFKEDGGVLGFFGEAFGTGGEKSEKKAGSSSKERASARFAHVPRQIMRLRMLERLKPGTVRWGSRVRSFEETSRYETSDAVASSRRAVRVTLEDGSVIDACLLVGSDGIHSTTRRLLRLKGDKSASSASDPDKLTFCGLAVVLGIVDDATFFCRLAKRRVFETVDGRARIYAMPFTTTSTMWQLSFPCSESDARVYAKDPKKLKAHIESLCANWHDPVPKMLASTKIDDMAGYPVYDREPLDFATLRPTGSENRRVTLIGDAAHPMTPFKAQGANQAVADAVLLARCLSEGVKTFGAARGVDAALPVFEKKMLARSSRVVRASREKAREMHSPLALAPARKAQRETGKKSVDMARVIERLRAAGVCAAHGEMHGEMDLDEIVDAVGFGGKSLEALGLRARVDKNATSAREASASREKKAKKEKKEKKEKKAKKEKKEKKAKKAKRERSPGSDAKEAKKAKRDAS